MRRAAQWMIMGAALAIGATGLAAGPAPDAQARAAASAWLALIDTGQYQRSWAQSATVFRASVPAGQWQQSVSAARAPLGRLRSRVLKSATLASSLPGAPDGEYLVLQFVSDFAHRNGVIETITPMRDWDGTWRVSGYFIK